MTSPGTETPVSRAIGNTVSIMSMSGKKLRNLINWKKCTSKKKKERILDYEKKLQKERKKERKKEDCGKKKTYGIW